MTNNKSRKTFNVGEILFKANYFLEHSKPEQVGERKGTRGLIESILHASGNYCGYGLLEHTTERVDGELIHHLGDESRVVYYLSNAVRADYLKAEKTSKEQGF